MPRCLLLLRWIVIGAGPLAAQVLSPPVIRSVAVAGSPWPVNLETQVGQPYNARVIENDVRLLWSTRRFEDIRVEAAEKDGGTAVTFRLTEAPRLRLHQVRIEPSSFGLRLKVEDGWPMDRLRAHEIAEEARKQLRAEGYLEARVDYALVPYGTGEVDLRLTIRAGEPVRVKEVTFAGSPGLDPRELRGALRALRIRRVLPKVRLRPAYSAEAVNSDLARLTSWYLARGYFDADIREGGVKIEGGYAYVRLMVESGPRYRVAKTTVENVTVQPGTRALCACLFAARRDAERHGILDFSARLAVERRYPAANLIAGIERGTPYRVGRIRFIGNQHYRDATLRRSFLLDEGGILDERLLRQSIARLNGTGLFEPIGAGQVMVRQDEKTGVADLDVRLTERKRGAWQLSGPAGPLSFAGPLEASLSGRLPSWGRGALELSTYTVSVSLFAFARPLGPVLALGRPFSPVEGWKSGFAFAPQLGWRASALSYGTTQVQHRLLTLLAGERGLVPDLPVVVERPAGPAVMVCEAPQPRLGRLRGATALGIELLGALPAFPR